jgi:DNA-directed RNA polymerase subunit RPC12/RpoP
VSEIKPANTRKRGKKRRQRGPGYRSPVKNTPTEGVLHPSVEIRKGTCPTCGYTITDEAAGLLRQSGASGPLNCPQCSGKIPF